MKVCFFACADGVYTDLIPIYKYCVKRVYPRAEVRVDKINHPACSRFLFNPKFDYVHITDIDTLVLPHEKSHLEYYSEHVCKGACYLRGFKGKHGKWTGDKTRICGGQFGAFPEFYEKTKWIRGYFRINHFQNYRQWDEVMLYHILKDGDYPIPEETYTFPDGENWDKEYRDLHIGDFIKGIHTRWNPDKEKLKTLFEEKEFKKLVYNLTPKWYSVMESIKNYFMP